MNTLRRYLEAALRDAGRIELRQIDPGSVRAGIYDICNAVEDAVVAIADTSTVFMSLNAPRLIPVSNAMTGKTLTDSDIGHIVRLPFDFDTVRPKGTNATDEEIKRALRRRDQFVGTMRSEGWPMPLLGMSGNGAHAVYRCRLPASAELRAMLTCVYNSLKVDYTDDSVLFDSTVRNPSRVWRIYSTLNRKAAEQPGRPQRIATCRIPARWECLSPKALVRFANQCAKRDTRSAPARVHSPIGCLAAGRGDYRTLDAASWFAAHGSYKRRLADNKHGRLPMAARSLRSDAGLAPEGSDTW